MRSITNQKAAVFLAVFCAFGLILQTAVGQGITTGTITGSVEDQQSAVVPQAQITVVQTTTNATFKTLSAADGLFTIHDLPIGDYTLTVTGAGFSPLTVRNLHVTSGVTANAGALKLAVGASTESVTVESAAPILETSEAQVSTSFDSKAIQSLPLNTNFDNLALLAPGVVQTHDASFSNSNGVGISANGQRGRSNNFEIDGQNNNDNNVGGPQAAFGNGDAISEIQIITDNFSAQYGRNLGSVVNYVTKSGTNQFHASGFEYYTGSWLSSLQNGQKSPLLGFCAPGQSASTGCTPVTVPRSVDNKYGGTLGGPILKDKLWFFGSTYWDHTRDGGAIATSQGAVTPTPNGLAQLQAAFPNNPAVASLVNQGPYGIKTGNPTPVPGTVGPLPVTVGTTTVPIEFGAVERTVPALFNDEENLGRLDWQPSTKDHFFVRYFYQNGLQTGTIAGNTNPAIAAGGYFDLPFTTHSVGADWTHTFSPAWIDQLRYSYQQAKTGFEGGGVPECLHTNFSPCPSQVSFQDGTDFAYGYNPAFPQQKFIKITQVQDNANWTHGRHSIAFGGEYDYQNSPGTYLPNYNGVLTFNTLADMLQGNGLLSLTDGNPVTPFKENDLAFYFQDDWKIRPDLTLNLGMRWEWFGQAVNILHNETVQRETGPDHFWDPALPLSIRTYQYTPNRWKNFQPRIGFAWNPNHSHLVVRGGYAINFDPGFYNIYSNAAIEAPVANAGAITCTGPSGYQCLPATGTTGASVRGQNLAALPIDGDPRRDVEGPLLPHFQNPYAQTYSLGVQYGIGSSAVVEVRYVGNHTAKLFQALNWNPTLEPLASAYPNYVSPSSLCQDPTAPGYLTLNCEQGALQAAYGNTAFSIYNSLQTNVTTRNFHGFTGTFQYTYSRTIDNTSEILPTGTGGNTLEYAQNPLNTNIAERGVSGISYPNVVAFGFVYQVPRLVQGNGLLSRLANGYSVNTIYGYNSGQPFTPFEGLQAAGTYCDDNFNGFVLGVSSCRPILTNASAKNSPSSYAVNNVTNADALNNPYPGVGRNTVRGQSWNNLDASVFKTTPITERISLQLQLNVFNSLNRQYLGTPGAFLGAVNFLTTAYNQGAPSPGAIANRSVQLGGKIIF
ncbi:MAG: TonB-dependent receptor [Silvibacterium sp.]|nr:TonB-dependent receptor [Silvibacterium sp.]